MTTIGPLISIVVATNRSSEFLPEALASVLAQTYRAFEIVLVDDGSPDPSAVARQAREIPDARWVRIPASGVSIARNVGVSMTSGDFLVFLDDDDRWHPDRLAAQVSALEEAPLAVAAYCGMEVIGADGGVLVPFDQAPARDRLDIARGGGGILLPNLMIRRSAFVATGGFHSRLRLAQDLDLTLRLAEYGPFVFVDRPLVQYRAHRANNTNDARHLVAAIRHIVNLHLSQADSRGDEQLASALRDRLRSNERYAWWRAVESVKGASDKDPRLAVGEYWWALTTYPRGLVTGITSRGRNRLARTATPTRGS